MNYNEIVKNFRELRDDEYYEDGMYYCKNCCSKKIYFIKIQNKVIVLYKKCKCELKKELEEEKRRKDVEKITKYIPYCLVLEKYINSKFENNNKILDKTMEKIYENCKKYCDNADKMIENNNNIYLFGQVGCGKTHLAICMMNYLMYKKFKTCIFSSFIDIEIKLKDIYSGINDEFKSENELIKFYSNSDFLFLDDIGIEEQNKRLSMVLFKIIDNRYKNKKPIIFTSNYDIKQLEEKLDYRIIDRISESIYKFKFDNKSFRSLKE